MLKVLKKCPCCGGEAKYEWKNCAEFDGYDFDFVPYGFVKCQICGLQTEMFEVGSDTKTEDVWEDTAFECAEIRWNYRIDERE
jgi:hypothetical protein